MKRQDGDKRRKYMDLIKAIDSALESEVDPVAWMSTLSCLIKRAFDFLWVGFYLRRGKELLVGPYQGGFGCLRIEFGRGVCGTAASKGETLVVADVHRFPGHIACDSRANSEIVVPVFAQDGGLKGVLDIDSSEKEAFNLVDKEFLEEITARMRSLKWNRLS